MFKIYLEKKNVPKDMAKLADAVLKEEMIGALQDWRNETLPKHFQPGAALRYKYHRRSIKHLIKKARGAGRFVRRRDGYAAVVAAASILPDMVYTGKSRDKMLADKRTPTGTTKRMTLRIRGVGFFHYRYPGWPHAMRDEVTRLTKDEMKSIYARLSQRLANRLANQRSHERYLLR